MYQTIELYLKNVLAQRAPWLLRFIYTYKREIKYIISGGTSALAALVTVYIATDIFKIWYLISVIFGQVIGFFLIWSGYWFFPKFLSAKVLDIPRSKL